MIIGDFNARIRNLQDYDSISNLNNENPLSTSTNPQSKRNACDVNVNTEGNKVINLCKSFDLMVLNGRTTGELIYGEITRILTTIKGLRQ